MYCVLKYGSMGELHQIARFHQPVKRPTNQKMASNTLKFTCSYRWVEEDADGQECLICGDSCYLFSVWRAEVTVKPIGLVLTMDDVVCSSCFDEAELR